MEWYQLITVFLVAFMVTYFMVPVSKWIAVKIGAVDYPSNRRVNNEVVPRCGGIALYLGLVAASFIVFIGIKFSGWNFNDLYVVNNVDYILLFLGVTAMFTVGLVDDVTQLSPKCKLFCQILAACLVVYSGVAIGVVRTLFDGDYVTLGWIDFPLSVLYLVVFVNIINLIDGLDGLASGTVVIIASGLMYLVYNRGSILLVMACLALVGVCIAFLRYNFSPASVFMGDSGSHLLGLMLGIISVLGVVRTQSLVMMLVPLVIAGVPVLDTLSAVIRRSRAHESAAKADLGHVHHRLLKAGLGQKRSVLVLWVCSGVLTAAGCLIVGTTGIVRWSVFGVLGVVLFIVIGRFGLFKPVLRHHYEGRGQRGPRAPRDSK